MMPDTSFELQNPASVEIACRSEAADHGSSKLTSHSVKGRFKRIAFDYYVLIVRGDEAEKLVVYGELLRSFIIDQRAWISDNSVVRVTNGNNAVQSLRIAEAATTAARKF